MLRLGNSGILLVLFEYCCLFWQFELDNINVLIRRKILRYGQTNNPNLVFGSLYGKQPEIALNLERVLPSILIILYQLLINLNKSATDSYLFIDCCCFVWACVIFKWSPRTKGFSTGNHIFKINNSYTIARCENCSKLTLKTDSVVSIVNFEHILHLAIVFLLLTLSR